VSVGLDERPSYTVICQGVVLQLAVDYVVTSRIFSFLSTHTEEGAF
jgi:hypothetical protein